ncbi:MAG TPA: TolC family protein [Vicinamibacterales bacterium]|nr:TolC family protein [Vicinamibacterales bacterium]
MITFRSGAAIVAVLCTASAASAQQPITLADATARALQRNVDVRVEREVVAASEAREAGALGSYDIRLHAEATEHHHVDPNTTLFSGAPPGELMPTATDFSSSVSLSKLFRSGATATASASVGRDVTNSFFTLFVPAYLTTLGVQVRQPLLRSRTTDSARTQLRITALDRQKTNAQLQTQVQEVAAAVEQAYWSLVVARREVEVRTNSVTLADQQRADTQARIDARTAAALDIAQPTAEVERRRGDLFQAQEAAARAERQLKLLMTDDPADPIWSQTLNPTDAVESDVRRVDVQRALAEAVTRRPEIAAAQTDVSSAEAQSALAKDALRPQVDVVAGYTMRGLAGTHNPQTVAFPGVVSPFPEELAGALGGSYEALFRQRMPDASIGVSVDVPLGRRGAKGDYGVAQAQQRQASLRVSQVRDRIAVEVLNAATALDTAASRIQSTRAGLQAATTQLQAEQERFSAGTSTNFLVLTRQNDLQQAQSAAISALADYRKALAEFARASGTLLSDRGITVK